MENIVEVIKKILLTDPEVKEKWEDLTHISGFSDALKSFKLLYFFVKKLVFVIELIQKEFGTIEKEERIEYAAKVLDDLIKFSGWAIFLEAIDEYIFKLVISQVVAALDDKFGDGAWFLSSAAVEELDNGNILYDEAKRVLS